MKDLLTPPPDSLFDSLDVKPGVGNPNNIKGSLIGPPLNLTHKQAKPLSLLEHKKGGMFDNLSTKKKRKKN